MTRPVELAESATIKHTTEWEEAKRSILLNPLWMPFYLLNQKVVGKILATDRETREQFFVRLRGIVFKASWNPDERGKVAADIRMHPHIKRADREHLLDILYQEGGSIDAIPAGLPGLGKKR